MSVTLEMGAGHPGRHGDSAAQPVVQASSCANALVTTRHPDMVVVCVWDPAGMKGDNNNTQQRNTVKSYN